MHSIFSRSQKSISLLAIFLLALSALLAGCGGGETGTSTGGTTETPTPTLTLTLTNPTTGATVTSVSANAPAKVTATLKGATGLAIPGKVVTFSLGDATMATMTPTTALTDSSGSATITLTGTAISGATEITGTTSVDTVSVAGAIGFTVSAGPPVTVTMTSPLFGVNTAPFAPAPLATYGTTPGSLSAFGTTSIAVAVSIDGVLASSSQTVNFSSICNTAGTAVLNASAVTVDGVATASYRDNGCAGTDTITATVSGNLVTATANLTVIPPTTGSIQFVSASPTNISLKGTGGTETSQITFKVLDSGGHPLNGKSVTFGLSTTIGGITLTPNTGVAPYSAGTAVSDSSGLVVTNVNSGTISTPVRVTASTLGANNVSLTTQSNQLTVSTGIPDDYGFSLSAQHNIEGWDYDGITSLLTARLADHFKNPVPDGTAVTFTAEGASIISNCTTTSGACTSTLTSQAGRPANGRITVLAYAVGEETFTDLSGNGWADLAPANEMIDPNNAVTDLAEAWVDYNENTTYDAATEPYIDFNGNGSYTAKDNKFSGVLCDETNSGRSSAGTCAANHTLHVRDSTVIILSTSQADITINNDTSPIVVPPCDPVTGIPAGVTFPVKVVDLHGNAMPAGTTVAFATDNGTIVGAASFIVPDSTGTTDLTLPSGTATFGDISVTVKTDATYASGVCTNTAAGGTFTVTVTTPKGNVTTDSARITD